MPKIIVHVNGTLEHKGIILNISADMIDVKIVAESACATCKVKGACGMSETEEKIIQVSSPDAAAYEVGEEVVVSVARSMGIKAVVFAYVIPFLLLLASLLVLLGAGMPEAPAGLISLGMMVVYYVVLWLFRKRFESEINFNIRKSEL